MMSSLPCGKIRSAKCIEVLIQRVEKGLNRSLSSSERKTVHASYTHCIEEDVCTLNGVTISSREDIESLPLSDTAKANLIKIYVARGCIKEEPLELTDEEKGMLDKGRTVESVLKERKKRLGETWKKREDEARRHRVLNL